MRCPTNKEHISISDCSNYKLMNGNNARKLTSIAAGLAFSLTLVLSGTAKAGPIGLDTVNWAADSSVDGTGTGVLGGTNTVTYTTAVGFNAGETFGETWASDLGTAGATGGSVSYQLGGVFGGASGGTTETITFSSTVSNPILLINFLGKPGGHYAADAFDFGLNAFTLLSSYDATASGNKVSSTTSVTDSKDDGFGILFNGDFGPGSPLVFTYSSDGTGPNDLQTVAFTVGTPVVTVPEPTSTALFGLGLAGLGFMRRRKAN